jgi:TonB-dependent SusC/RagA subfamily outer membrane receptor
MSKYFLHIDEPCSQNWNEMAPAENGKFCNSCNKSVFDFTTASDGEIARYMDKHTDEELICGRFRESQLDKWLHIAETKRTNPALYKLLMSTALITAGQSLYAQAKVKQEHAPQALTDSARKKVINYGEYTDVECAPKLSGHVPDVFVSAEQHTSKVIIMGGIRSLSGNNEPMLVVDGRPRPLSELSKISPDKIKSTSILKNATAVALYGTNAIHGVIIVETKYSKKEKKKLFR